MAIRDLKEQIGRLPEQPGVYLYLNAAGDTIYVPTAMFHSTVNTGWQPLRLLALYNPGGAEKALRELPDFREGAGPDWALSS